MSVQVGLLCFAAPVDAGPAACAAFSPVTSLSGDVVTTVSCSGSDTLGALLMQRSVVTGSSSPVITSFTQSLAYPPCIQSDYLVAVEVVFGAGLAAWALIWGTRKVLHLFNHLPVS